MKDRKEYMRVWRKKNRDKINQKYKEWRESKGDELRPYKRVVAYFAAMVVIFAEVLLH